MLLLSIQDIIAKLEEEIFTISNFSVKLWMIVAAAALVLIILLIVIIAAAKKAKKRKRIAASTEIENSDEPVETVSVVSEDTIDNSEVTDVHETTTEVVNNDAVEDTTTTAETTSDIVEEKPTTRRRKTSTTSTTTTKKKTTRTKKDTKVDEPVETSTTDNTGDDTAETKKDRPRVYHVSIREDGKWQVKFAKGARAIKTFATQLEAIDYAKKLAVSQKGSIMIHKKDGKIRKLKY